MAKPRSPLDTYTPPEAPGLVARVAHSVKAFLTEANWAEYAVALSKGDVDAARGFLLQHGHPVELITAHSQGLAAMAEVERVLRDTEHSGENLPVLRAEADVLRRASPRTADDAAAIARRLAECTAGIQAAIIGEENRRVATLHRRGLESFFAEIFGRGESRHLTGTEALPPAVRIELGTLGLDPYRQSWTEYRRPAPQRVRKLRATPIH